MSSGVRTSERKRLESPDLYSVAWISPLPLERAAATALLDHQHAEPQGFTKHLRDTNSYTWGEMGNHNVVIASLKAGVYGTTSAATTALSLLSSLPQIKFGLLVGIGGGIVRPRGADIRLGDVVVSQPSNTNGGVVQYDLMKAKPNGEYEGKAFLNMPPLVLLNALSHLQANHKQSGSKIPELLKDMWNSNPNMLEPEDDSPGFCHQGMENDRLFRSTYTHVDGSDLPSTSTDNEVDSLEIVDCRFCDPSQEIQRKKRKLTKPRIHYGTIASSNTLFKDPAVRNTALQAVGLDGCLCVEMEAAGLMNDFPCLVIRGVCDYADSHKNDQWQPYAAATAAAFAKELLQCVQAEEVRRTKTLAESIESIKDKLQEMDLKMSNTEKVIKSGFQKSSRDEVFDIFDWLSRLNSQDKQKDIFKQYHEGTGKYLLANPVFEDWLNGKNRIIWCIGSPGTGKTVLASAVINTVANTIDGNKDAALAYLYCAYAERNSQTIDQLLGSILRQLLNQRSEIPNSISKLYETHKKSNTRPDCDKLCDELRAVASLFAKVFIIVDALDECDDTYDIYHKEGLRGSLLRQLQSLGPDVQFFFTSRPLEYPDDFLLDAVQFRVTAQEADIRNFLSVRIREVTKLVNICKKNIGLEEEIIDTIVSKADGMFLLVKFHFQSIIFQLRAENVRRALKTLPTELNATYDEALRRIQDGQDKERSKLAIRILKLLSYALRPLKLGEIQHALLTFEAEEDDNCINHNDIYDKETLLEICAGIIIFEDAAVAIRFVHHTAESYFELKRAELFPNAQIEFADMCITYLSFAEFRRGCCRTTSELEKRLETNKLYDYAANNWGHHARDTPTLSRKVVKFLENKPSMEASSQVLLLERDYNGEIKILSESLQRKFTGLHLAAFFGLTYAVEDLCKSQENLDAKDDFGRNALFLAAKNGFDDIVKLLLSTDRVDPDLKSNKKDDEGWTPLLHATAKGHQAIVEMLLNTDRVNPNLKESRQSGETPLTFACRRGDETVVKLLLGKGADPDLRNGNEVRLSGHHRLHINDSMRKPLGLAAQHGKKNIVELLIQANCKINAIDGFNGSVVLKSPFMLHVCSEAMLLDVQRLDFVKEFGCGWSALHWAAVGGHVETIDFLLLKGADVSAQDLWGGNVLSVAVAQGHCQAAELLLDKGAEIEHPLGMPPDFGWRREESVGWRVLHVAAARRDAEMVHMLLSKGADPNARDARGWSPLKMAIAGMSQCGHHVHQNPGWKVVPPAMGCLRTTVRHLYQHGADVNHLNAVALFGDADIAEYLLELGADVDAGILQLASLGGNFSVVEFLIKSGRLDANAEFDGWYPLHPSAGNGCYDIVVFLVENGADVNAQVEENGLTPLMSAICYNRTEVVKYLLEQNPNLDLQTKNGKTALHAAAGYNHKEIFDLLLEKGANPDIKDKDGLIPELCWGVEF